jgi:glyceraldehyde 3-phosphate dehydrogenase
MAARVGLMGFGRIGRNVFRQTRDHPAIEVAAIADIADPEALAYLLEYDTIFGRYPEDVFFEAGNLHAGDLSVPMLDGADPGEVDWSQYGIDVVVQATRKHRTLAECSRHLDKGASRVILASTPEIADEIPTIIIGVNEGLVTPDDAVIALGSNTSNALAPVLKALDARFGIHHALFTVVHAFTNEARLADVPGGEFRTSRAAAENIIPAATNSAEIIERVLPGLEGRLAGMALNVPVADGSNVDLVAFLDEPTDADTVNEFMRETAETSHVVEFTTDPIVSSDVIGNPHSAVWDGLATLVVDETMLKCIIWFDNGWGYAARVVDAIEMVSPV